MNPFFIALKPYFPDEMIEIIVLFINVNYCKMHDSIFPRHTQCIGCMTSSIDLKYATQNKWAWFRIHHVEMSCCRVIHFDLQKDYYFYQHLIHMIPKPELYWLTPNYNSKKLNVGIFKTDDGYLIVIVNFVEDHEELLDEIFHGQTAENFMKDSCFDFTPE